MTWAETNLGKFAPFAYGKGLPKDKRIPGSVRVYGSNGVVDSHSEALVPDPAVIVGRKGSVGEVHFSEGPSWPIDTAFYVQGSDKADLHFLFYLLQTLPITSNSDSVVPGLSREYAHSIEFKAPSLKTQRAIGKSLGVFDRKISLNDSLSKTLEEIARSIFKSWFIDFDPVKAKMAGKTPVGMDAETAALFPDSMEEGGSVDLPSGWSSVTIDDLCASISNGSTPKRSVEEFWENPVIDWYKTGELRDNFLLRAAEGISETGIESSSVRVMPGGTVLMAIYAAPTVGRLGILTEDSVFNQACTGLVPRPEIGTAFLYMTLKHLRPFFIGRSNGAAQQNISKLIVESAPCIRAPREIQEKFNELVSPIFELWESLTKENARLSEIRDSLLPRLVSGELEIPDEMLAA